MFLPLMVDVDGYNVYIIGGGKVALRRANKFLEYGAMVTVVSPEVEDGLRHLERVCWIKDRYRFDYIKTADIVIVATNDKAVNEQVSQDCKLLKCLCNRCDETEKSDLLIPMSLIKGDLTIAVSTNGQSPMLAKQLMKDIEAGLDSEISERLQLMGSLRSKIIASTSSETEKKGQLESLLKMDIASLRAYNNVYK